MNGSCGPSGCGACHRPCTDTAECPEHGANCEPDDHVEPPTVDGELI